MDRIKREGKCLCLEVDTQQLSFLKLCVYLSYIPSCLHFFSPQFKFQRKLQKMFGLSLAVGVGSQHQQKILHHSLEIQIPEGNFA